MKHKVTPDQRKLILAISSAVKEYTHQYNPIWLNSPEDFENMISLIVENALKIMENERSGVKL